MPRPQFKRPRQPTQGSVSPERPTRRRSARLGTPVATRDVTTPDVDLLDAQTDAPMFGAAARFIQREATAEATPEFDSLADDNVGAMAAGTSTPTRRLHTKTASPLSSDPFGFNDILDTHPPVRPVASRTSPGAVSIFEDPISEDPDSSMVSSDSLSDSEIPSSPPRVAETQKRPPLRPLSASDLVKRMPSPLKLRRKKIGSDDELDQDENSYTPAYTQPTKRHGANEQDQAGSTETPEQRAKRIEAVKQKFREIDLVELDFEYVGSSSA